MRNNYNGFNIILINIIFLSFLISNSKEQRKILSINFPNILTLLNQNIIMVAQDGIHYFNSDLTIEDVSKKIIFENQVLNSEQDEKTSIAQFSSEDGGYIIVLSLNIIYFLTSEGIFIDSKNLSSIIDGEHYCITPYKNDNNNLHYIIDYPSSDNEYKGFTLLYSIYSLSSQSIHIVNSKIIEVKIGSYNNNPSYLEGVSCLILTHPSLNYNILTCFYGVSYVIEIQSKSFDLNNNLEEISDLFYYCYDLEQTGNIQYISVVPNENKQKVFIFYFSTIPYYLTFDFEKKFSKPISLFEQPDFSIRYGYYFSRTFYFSQTNEIICVLSYNERCKKLIIVFNSDFTLKNKVDMLPSESSYCYNTFSFGVFFDGINYNIVYDNGVPVDSFIFINEITDLGNNQISEDLIKLSESSLNFDDRSESLSENAKYKDNKTELFTGETKTESIETENSKTEYIETENSKTESIEDKTDSKTEYIENETDSRTQYIEAKTDSKTESVENETDVIIKCDIEDLFNKNEKCKINSTNTTDIKQVLTNKIREDLTNGNMDSMLSNIIENNTDLLAKENNVLYQITTSDNQDNNEYNNISTIHLGDCEQILRSIYHLDNSTKLLIFKIDVFEEGHLTPKIEYEVYESVNKTKLELSHCNNVKIDLSIPVTIDETSLYKYNLSDGYYNDKCCPSSSDNGIDITLSDRRDEFYNNNLSLCEENCDFVKYDIDSKKAICNCEVKTDINLFTEKIDKDKFFKNFIDIKTITNIDIIKCYKVLFTKKGLIKNIGSYIILFIILIHIIFLIAFLLKGHKSFMNQINNIIKSKEKKKRYKK